MPTLLDDLKTLAISSAALRQEPQLSTQQLRDVIYELEEMKALLDAAERVVREMIPFYNFGGY